jgi:hypothetical protein
MISNIEAVADRGAGCSITGLAGHEAENITIENVRISFPGGGSAEHAVREVPENEEKYPEFGMFGMLPAYALYCRHVRNLKLRNIETRFEGHDSRPALVCDHVQDLELSGSRFAVEEGVKAAVRFRDVRDAFIHGCRSKRRAAEWLEISGDKDSVVMQANNLG